MEEIKSLNVKTPIILTESAAVEVEKLRKHENHDSSKALRIGVKGGGCAGFSYIMEFDSATADDEVFSSMGVQLLMNKAHKLYLNGTKVDYSSGLGNRGFTFTNPNADSTCGCGSSFG